MPLQTIDFSKIPVRDPDYSGIRDIFSNYYKGYELGQTPRKLQEEAIKRALENQKLGVEARYAEPLATANLGIQQAEAQYRPASLQAAIEKYRADAEKARQEKGLGGLTGSMGNAARLFQLEQKYGPDHPLVQQLKEFQNLEKRREEGKLDYTNKVAQSLYYRSLTPLQKQFTDLDMLDQGKAVSMMGDVYDLTPAQQKQRRLATGKKIIEEITSEPLRKRVEFGNNMLTTFENIDPDKAFKYSGGLGGLAKTINKAGGLTGAQSKEYKEFQENLTRLKILAKQASQFMDAPAAQAIQEGIDEIANPNAWFTSPEVAKAKYEAFKKLMEKEHTNILRSVIDPSVYGVQWAPSTKRGAMLDVGESVSVDPFGWKNK